MSKPRRIISSEEIVRFNEVRRNAAGKVFDRTEILTLLHGMGLSKNITFLSYITKGVNPPIVRIDRNKYAFVEKPVHIARLQQVVADWSKKVSSYNKKYRHPDMKNEEKELSEIDSKIKEAIKLLKDNGFKVLKPKVEYEEI